MTLACITNSCSFCRKGLIQELLLLGVRTKKRELRYPRICVDHRMLSATHLSIECSTVIGIVVRESAFNCVNVTAVL